MYHLTPQPPPRGNRNLALWQNRRNRRNRRCKIPKTLLFAKKSKKSKIWKGRGKLLERQDVTQQNHDFNEIEEIEKSKMTIAENTVICKEIEKIEDFQNYKGVRGKGWGMAVWEEVSAL